jgi:hypothetical protein
MAGMSPEALAMVDLVKQFGNLKITMVFIDTYGYGFRISRAECCYKTL